MGDFAVAAAAAAAAATDTNLGCTFCCDCVWSEEEMAEESAVAVAGSGRYIHPYIHPYIHNNSSSAPSYLYFHILVTLYAPCASIILDGIDII